MGHDPEWQAHDERDPHGDEDQVEVLEAELQKVVIVARQVFGKGHKGSLRRGCCGRPRGGPRSAHGTGALRTDMPG